MRNGLKYLTPYKNNKTMNVRILYIIIFNFIQVVSAQDESVFQKKSIYDICCWGSTIGNINYYHLNNSNSR